MLTWCALAYDVLSVGASDGDRLWYLSSLLSPRFNSRLPLSQGPSLVSSLARVLSHVIRLECYLMSCGMSCPSWHVMSLMSLMSCAISCPSLLTPHSSLLNPQSTLISCAHDPRSNCPLSTLPPSALQACVVATSMQLVCNWYASDRVRGRVLTEKSSTVSVSSMPCMRRGWTANSKVSFQTGLLWLCAALVLWKLLCVCVCVCVCVKV